MSAPKNRWPLIQDLFSDWANTSDLEPLPPCRHRSGAMYRLAVDWTAAAVHQLDVRSRVTYRMARLFDAEELEPVVVDDERGFQKVRNGTEGLLNLFLKCVDSNGLLDQAAVKEKRVEEMINDDWPGVTLGSKFFRQASDEAMMLAENLIQNRWDVRDANRTLRKISAMAIREPNVVAGLISNLPNLSRCPLLRVLMLARPVGDFDRFISSVRSTHA